MGEYATINGTGLKLGTIDDLRYVRHDELERWHAQGTPDLSCYLDDKTTLYRFPYPWEDAQSPAQVGKRNMFEPVITLRSPQFEGLEHKMICKGFSFPGGGYNVNVYVPCPYTIKMRGNAPGQTTLCSALPEFRLRIYGERWSDGHGRTIFSCPYCEHLYSLDGDKIAQLKAENQPSPCELRDIQDLRPVLDRLTAREGE